MENQKTPEGNNHAITGGVVESKYTQEDLDSAYLLSFQTAIENKKLKEANAKLVEEIERLKLIVEGKDSLQDNLVTALKEARKLIEEKGWHLSSEYLTICQAIKLTK